MSDIPQPTIESRRNCAAPLTFRVGRLDMLRGMTNWAAETVNRTAAEIRRRRQELGLSAQALSERTTALGHTVSRATISDLELGRRGERLLVPDLIVLAAALQTSPGVLMFPDQPHGAVEVLPNVEGTSSSAARWLGDGLIFDLPGGQYAWPDDEDDFYDVMGSNELVSAGKRLEQLLEDVESARGFARRSGLVPDDMRGMWLDRYEANRVKALEWVAKVRELGGTLDEERLAALGVVEGGGQDG